MFVATGESLASAGVCVLKSSMWPNTFGVLCVTIVCHTILPRPIEKYKQSRDLLWGEECAPLAQQGSAHCMHMHDHSDRLACGAFFNSFVITCVCEVVVVQ